MDQYFIPLYLLEESALMGIILLLIVAGGTLAAFTTRVQVVYRRVTYLWFVALLGLGLTASQLLWALSPAAADIGMIWLLLIATMGSFAVFGALLYYASAARSRHIKGDTSNAWMGFVPLANLWLLFKRGGTEDASQRSKLSRLVFDPLLVFGAIVVLSISQVVNTTLDDIPAFDPDDSLVLTNLLRDTQTLEDIFAAEVRASRALLPILVDEITLLSEIEADGKTLRMTYDLQREFPGFRSDFKSTLAETQCAPEMFGNEIARGGTIEMIYRSLDGNVIQTYAIINADCPT
jgi:hypothetical protein